MVTTGTAAVLLLAAIAAGAAELPDPTRGRALYENHCQLCHTANIHKRPSRIALTRQDVRVIVDDWRRQENLGWTPQEVEDVVEYLNRTRYHFAPVERRGARDPDSAG